MIYFQIKNIKTISRNTVNNIERWLSLKIPTELRNSIFEYIKNENYLLCNYRNFKEYSLNNNYNGSAFLSGGAFSNSEGIAFSILNVNPSIFSPPYNDPYLASLELQVTIIIPSTALSDNVSINI